MINGSISGTITGLESFTRDHGFELKVEAVSNTHEISVTTSPVIDKGADQVMYHISDVPIGSKVQIIASSQNPIWGIKAYWTENGTFEREGHFCEIVSNDPPSPHYTPYPHTLLSITGHHADVDIDLSKAYGMPIEGDLILPKEWIDQDLQSLRITATEVTLVSDATLQEFSSESPNPCNTQIILRAEIPLPSYCSEGTCNVPFAIFGTRADKAYTLEIDGSAFGKFFFDEDAPGHITQESFYTYYDGIENFHQNGLIDISRLWFPSSSPDLEAPSDPNRTQLDLAKPRLKGTIILPDVMLSVRKAILFIEALSPVEWSQAARPQPTNIMEFFHWPQKVKAQYQVTGWENENTIQFSLYGLDDIDGYQLKAGLLYADENRYVYWEGYYNTHTQTPTWGITLDENKTVVLNPETRLNLKQTITDLKFVFQRNDDVKVYTSKKSETESLDGFLE